eukprot:UN11012
MEGHFTNVKPTFKKSKWFWRRITEEKTIILDIRDYLFRYDESIFWLSETSWNDFPLKYIYGRNNSETGFRLLKLYDTRTFILSFG